MHSFIKSNNHLLSLFLVSLLHSSLSAVTFKNEPLTHFVQPGEFLCATIPENCCVILDIENSNFDINQANIEQFDNLKEAFQKVTTNRSGCSMSSNSFNTSSNNINFNGSYLNGRENMNIQGKISIQLIHCLLESPLISITGSKMKFVDSFLINPEVFNIIIDAPESDYDSIQIMFYDQPENPTVITGEIDLNNDQEVKRLIISNVKEVNVRFKWDKSLPKKSHTEETATITKSSHPQKSDFKNRTAINQESLPCHTYSQYIDKYFTKNISFPKEFLPVIFWTAVTVCFMCYDSFYARKKSIIN
jgi:hypothetical protein